MNIYYVSCCGLSHLHTMILRVCISTSSAVVSLILILRISIQLYQRSQHPLEAVLSRGSEFVIADVLMV